MNDSTVRYRPSLINSGIAELDDILCGGLTANCLYLIEGDPGTGKTTLALQFLLDGAQRGEKGLYVALSETEEELRGVASSHGWSLDGIGIHELVDHADALDADSQYSMFQPSEVELGITTQAVLDRVDQIQPRRVVFDSLSELRMLAQSSLRYRRQILALKQFFVGRNCTVLLLDDKTAPDSDLQLQSLAHGVINLEQMMSNYGGERRRLRVTKFRGRQYQGGYHDYQIKPGGLKIHPRTASPPSGPVPQRDPLRSGNESLDALLGDGLASGSSALMLGPAGVGKSSCATLYAIAAMRRGERAAMFIFDEGRETLLTRSAGLGMDLAPYLESGLLMLEQIDPGDLSPGEFAHKVRQAVDPPDRNERASVVVIDSLNGYMNAMPEERYLSMQLHELLTYLGSRGVVTFIVVAQHGMLGQIRATSVDTSYLADTVLLFRYFEAAGEIRQAISVIKKRTGSHERTIREFSMKNGEIIIGEPLRGFHGVLTGTPTFVGEQSDLLGRGHE